MKSSPVADRILWQFATEDWKPFTIALLPDKPGVIRLEYGGRVIEAPIPDEVNAFAPRRLRIFFGWGIGAQGKGAVLLDGLKFSSARVIARAAR